jgi:hypothetical protein
MGCVPSPDLGRASAHSIGYFSFVEILALHRDIRSGFNSFISQHRAAPPVSSPKHAMEASERGKMLD